VDADNSMRNEPIFFWDCRSGYYLARPERRSQKRSSGLVGRGTIAPRGALRALSVLFSGVVRAKAFAVLAEPMIQTSRQVVFALNPLG